MTGDSAYEGAQQTVFEEAGIAPESRFIDLDPPGVRVQVLDNEPDQSDEIPVLFLHSGGTFGAYVAPLMAQLEHTRSLAIDRPGFGLSSEFEYRGSAYRQTIADVLSGLLDELDLEQGDLAGNSTGGYWRVVYALAQPHRVRQVTLLGGMPALPGTSSPIPLRLYSVPVLNRLLGGMFLATSEKAVIEKFEMFGEGDSIQRYPALIRAIAARDGQPHAHELDISDMSSLLTPWGWRSPNQLTENELREIAQPTLVGWGEDDPRGGPEDVRHTIGMIPNTRFESLDTGHVPWLGHPSACADLIRNTRTPCGCVLLQRA